MAEPQGMVFIADSARESRATLSSLLESFHYHVESFDTGEAIIERMSMLDGVIPGCILSELQLPDMMGLEVLRTAQRLKHPFPVIYLTDLIEIDAAVEALQNGAFGFLRKPHDNPSLLHEVERAVRESRQRFAIRKLQASISTRLRRLTPREREVMQLMIRGQASKTIAKELELSPRTVESHRAKVMHKMRAGSLPELVRYQLILEEDSLLQKIAAQVSITDPEDDSPAGD